jgi:hypothetical protein
VTINFKGGNISTPRAGATTGGQYRGALEFAPPPARLSRVAAVPLPAGAWLLAAGIAAWAGLSRAGRRRAGAVASALMAASISAGPTQALEVLRFGEGVGHRRRADRAVRRSALQPAAATAQPRTSTARSPSPSCAAATGGPARADWEGRRSATEIPVDVFAPAAPALAPRR